MIQAVTVEVLFDDEAHLDDLRLAFGVEVHGQRLDVLVAERLGVAVRQVHEFAALGLLRVDGRAVIGGFPRVAAGARVVVLGGRARPALLPERIPLTILDEDEGALFVDKPARMAMTPGAGHPAGTLANALRGLGRPLSSVEGPLRPGIVHRLDWGTSGVVIVAKDDASHRRIAEQFLTHAAERRYLALVHGHPRDDVFTIDAPLARRRLGRKAFAVRDGGRAAQTTFTVRARLGADVALVEAVPATGRTHQVRVHLAHAGHPLLGDTVYAGAARRPWARLGIRRPALHAASLALLGRAAHAPLPDDLAAAVRQLTR
jgi:23S rRNA pseudouridine1911/1915/1917 synthase